MKTSYRVIEVQLVCTTLFRAQFKPWWFPFWWVSCYGLHFCIYRGTAERICYYHNKGLILDKDELDFVIQNIDSNFMMMRKN